MVLTTSHSIASIPALIRDWRAADLIAFTKASCKVNPMACLVGHAIDHAGMKRLLRTKASAKTGYLRILLRSTYTSAPDTAGPRLECEHILFGKPRFVIAGERTKGERERELQLCLRLSDCLPISPPVLRHIASRFQLYVVGWPA